MNALVTTNLAAAAGGVSWMLVDWVRKGRPSAVGMAVGAVCGLAAVTPPPGYVGPAASIIIGFVAGICLQLHRELAGPDDARRLARRLRLPRSRWDVGHHRDGSLRFDGDQRRGPERALLRQPSPGAAADAAVGGRVATFAFVGTYVLLRVINVFSPLRVGPAEEDAGLDVSEFGEEAYDPGDRADVELGWARSDRVEAPAGYLARGRPSGTR